MPFWLGVVVWPVAVVAVLLVSTVVFDGVHWTLHRFADSRWSGLRRLGGLHATHHAFLDRELRVHPELIGANIRRHVIPEYLTQAGVSAVLLWLLPVSVVAGAFALQTGVFLWILSDRGLDINHRGQEKLAAHRPSVFCLPEYHALHHVHPSSHYSSWIKLLDWLLGTGTQLAGRPAAWVGPPGGLAEQLVAALERRGTRPTSGSLLEADILVVDGDAATAADLADAERFAAGAPKRRLPPELWWVSAQAPARALAGPPDLQFRHLALEGHATPAIIERAIDRVARGRHRA